MKNPYVDRCCVFCQPASFLAIVVLKWGSNLLWRNVQCLLLPSLSSFWRALLLKTVAQKHLLCLIFLQTEINHRPLKLSETSGQLVPCLSLEASCAGSELKVWGMGKWPFIVFSSVRNTLFNCWYLYKWEVSLFLLKIVRFPSKEWYFILWHRWLERSRWLTAHGTTKIGSGSGFGEGQIQFSLLTSQLAGGMGQCHFGIPFGKRKQ